MSNKQELKWSVLNQLDEIFQAQDFQLIKSTEWFAKQNQANRLIYDLVFLDKFQGYQVLPEVGVRNELIENIFHKISGLEKRYQKDSFSVVNSIKDQSTNRNGRYDLYGDCDIDDVVQKLKTLFYDHALAYFDKFSQIENIDQALNDNLDSPKRTFLLGNCSRGLIVAQLLGRKDYAELFRQLL
ncbi:MAG: hypothetical protein DRR16_29390 [Candidatus Parabeggiatoa sp. nov. 3]|nr:MAG: hypothetical protein DRR00_27060 [Gammaproteobacteria bacterium]RKZ59198.1 MAG: hypothetical protein DRQ99_24110 [Gammaproteobacteria bacterium]RKZ77570.1 MAG: hypothetical protein DRR16_29390 [Gammaproteobacteria bacterium]